MTDSSETIEARPAWTRTPQARFARRVLYPLAIIAAIIAVIWYLDTRGDDDRSPTGEEYGIRDLPAKLVPAGAKVAAEEGALAPDFLLELAGGGETHLSDYRGQPVVLNFWATWCKPCRQEMPQLVNAYDTHKDEGLVVIGLNLQEGRSVIQPFADEYGMDFPLLIDRDGDVGDKYRLLGLPTTVFIDADGVIQRVFNGPLQEEENGTNVQGAIGESDLEAGIQEILRGD
jgi:peroxiredoxin